MRIAKSARMPVILGASLAASLSLNVAHAGIDASSALGIDASSNLGIDASSGLGIDARRSYKCRHSNE